MPSPHTFLSLFLALACSSPAPAQPTAPPPLYRLPVHIVDCAGSAAGRAPAALIGTLFTGGMRYREYNADRLSLTPPDQLVLPCPCLPNKFSPVMTEYLLGNVRPRPSAKDEDTCAFITSPPLANGYDGGIGVGGLDFTIDALTLQGNAYTATTTFWHDNSVHQWGPGPLVKGQMLRLSTPGYGPGGWLRPGQYTFTLITRELFMDVTDSAAAAADKPAAEHANASATTVRPLYRLLSTKSASTTFTVVDGEPWQVHTWDQPPSTAIITTENLQPLSAPAPPAQSNGPETWPRWQPPVFAVNRVDGKALRPENAPVYKDGSRELRLTFSSQAPGSWKKHAPAAKPLWDSQTTSDAAQLPTSKGLVIARVAGVEWDHRIAPADTAELLAVQWTATDAVTLHIGLWRRSQADQRTQIPELIIPLETRGLPGTLEQVADRLKVTIAWEDL